MTTLTANTKTLSTDALEVGMIVHHHGARFRLTEMVFTAEDAAHSARFAGSNVEPTLRAFSTELLGNVIEGVPHGIPASWLYMHSESNALSIQGNHRAFWTVEA